MFKKVKALCVVAVMMMFAGRVSATEGEAGKAPLEQMSLKGAIVQKVTQTKSGSNRTHYYLETAENGSLKLANNQSEGKKGYDDAAKVDLKNFVDKNVQMNVKATKSKKGKILVKYITKMTEL